MSNPALLIVDIQNDYFAGGRMELVDSDAAAASAARLIARFRDRDLPVIFIQHIATKTTATFFLPDTPGAEIHESVRPREGEAVIVKHFPNGFRETSLLNRLRYDDIGSLVIAGMMTHMCIDATTRAAADLGFDCTVAADACATRDLAFGGEVVRAAGVHRAFLAALDGTYAKVLSAKDALPA